MTANLDNLGQGNTDSCPPKGKFDKFCFTWHNYTTANLDYLKNAEFYSFICFGEEITPSNGTPHLQGYFELPHKRYMKGLLTTDMKGVSKLLIAKGTADQNRDYCSKDDKFFEKGTAKKPHGGKREKKTTSLRETLKQKVLKKYENTKWKNWQEKILKILEKTPDNRKIHWIWEETGNIGKSFLAKYIACNYEGVIICDGKKENIFNQTNNMIENGIEPKIVLMDIPRTLEGKIHFGTIEQLKNGMIYSGKYEGGQCFFDDVHIIAFANFQPDLGEMSEDRWEITDLNDYNDEI